MPSGFLLAPPTLLSPPESPLTQAQLLAVYDRVLPDTYLLPLKSPGPGYELLQAFAAMDARVSQAAVNALNVFILSSQGGQLAQGFVELSRPTALTIAINTTVALAIASGTRTVTPVSMANIAVGSRFYVNQGAGDQEVVTVTAITATTFTAVFALAHSAGAALGLGVLVQAGTVITTSQGGRNFFTVDDAIFGVNDLVATDVTSGQQSIAIQAAAAGYEWNVQGQVNAANGDVLVGDIDTILLLFENPPFWDPSVEVTNVVPISGGRPAVLDQIGADMGLGRFANESDMAFATRLRTLPDTVSPGAIQRAVASILGPYGLTAVIQEPLGFGALPPLAGFSGIIVGFADVDPVPPLSAGFGFPGPTPFWAPSTNYVTISQVQALPGTGGPIAYIFQGVSGGGRSGTSQPNFAGTTPGNTVVDGGTLWLNTGIIVSTAPLPGAIGLWYMDQNLSTGLPGPGLNVRVPPGSTAALGLIGPSGESNATSRGYFRVIMPSVKNVNPGFGFGFADVAPYPPQGFFDNSFGDGIVTPTGVVAGQIYGALQSIKEAGVGVDVYVVG